MGNSIVAVDYADIDGSNLNAGDLLTDVVLEFINEPLSEASESEYTAFLNDLKNGQITVSIGDPTLVDEDNDFFNNVNLSTLTAEACKMRNEDLMPMHFSGSSIWREKGYEQSINYHPQGFIDQIDHLDNKEEFYEPVEDFWYEDDRISSERFMSKA